MNKFTDYFGDVPGLILISFLLLVLIFLIIITIKIFLIHKEITNKKLQLKEHLITNGKTIEIENMLINQSYVDNEVSEYGLYYDKKKIKLNQERIKIKARDSVKYHSTIDYVKSILNIKKFKLLKLEFYFEDTVGNMHTVKAKQLSKYIKVLLKYEKKQHIIKSRKERIENGNLIARDRFRLIMEIIFNPFVKLYQKIIRSLNSSLSDSKIKKDVIKHEKDLIEKLKKQEEAKVRKTKKERLEEQYNIKELEDKLVDQSISIDESLNESDENNNR